jgi:hypothetical protein
VIDCACVSGNFPLGRDRDPSGLNKLPVARFRDYEGSLRV